MNNSANPAVDYGPLTGLIGTWKGDKGQDLSPEPDGTEENLYHETLVFEPARNVTNAEEQTLVALRYHQTVARNSTGKIIHDEVGYLSYDAESGSISHSLTIPRGVCILASGEMTRDGGRTTYIVKAGEAGIMQTPFMSAKAQTRAFEKTMTLHGDTLSYRQTMALTIYDREFDHTDENLLQRQS